MNFRSPFQIVSLIAFTAGSANADAVSLRSPDGGFNLEGTYIEFANGRHVVATPIGTLRVKAEKVDCFGTICPRFDFDSADIRVLAADQREFDLTLKLFEAYAAERVAALRVFDLPTRGKTFADAIGEDGKVVRLSIVQSSKDQSLERLASGSGDVFFSHQTEVSAEISSGVLALEGLVPVAHSEHTEVEISLGQMQDVLSGRFVNSDELGGEDYQLILSGSFASPGIGTDVQTTPDDSAVSLLPEADVDASQVLQLLDSCQMPAAPDGFAIKSGEYPLARQIFIHRSNTPASDAAKDFVTFALSEKVADLLTAADLYHPAPEMASMQQDGPRGQMLAAVEGAGEKTDAARNMLEVMVDYQRLSTTLRFPTGSFDITHFEEAELFSLAEHLAKLPSGTRVIFAGFTDDIGTFERNQPLSATRAAVVASAVAQLAGENLDGLSIETHGFGELAPIACNADRIGRSMNRRVEIWIDGMQDEVFRTVANMNR